MIEPKRKKIRTRLIQINVVLISELTETLMTSHILQLINHMMNVTKDLSLIFQVSVMKLPRHEIDLESTRWLIR